MGQAKLRGDRDVRIAKALGLREMSINDVKKEYGLSQDATFLGYGVHLEKSDEFLAAFDESHHATRKAWATTPEAALMFQSFADAHDTSKACAGSIIVGMFDTGDQIFVAGITGIRSV
ncbi:MAG: hypothetical protein BGP19_05935 [Thiobacillus sp. 0-1251]|nr:MAG: hypothetical protein BGP19_05935 [Thiobacillus sp. 0-1251]